MAIAENKMAQGSVKIPAPVDEFTKEADEVLTASSGPTRV
jgi:hypothetical protein